MRHNVYGSHLSRTSEQRQHLFRSLIENLFIFKSIQTTEAKAKAVRGLVDKVINQAKAKDLKAKAFIQNKKAYEALVGELLPGLANRKSGYVSLIRVGQRKGDGAMMVKMSLLLEPRKDKSANIERKARTGLSVRKTTSTKKKGDPSFD